MATFTIASAKGGCGKTTLAILLAAELALEGYTVTLLDCDLNQHATAFGAKAKISGLEITGNVTETNVLAELKKAEAASDLVLIDLPGGSSTLAIKALQRSHFVLVPTQASLMDVRDATKTIAQIDDAEELARSPSVAPWSGRAFPQALRAARRAMCARAWKGRGPTSSVRCCWSGPPSARYISLGWCCASWTPIAGLHSTSLPSQRKCWSGSRQLWRPQHEQAASVPLHRRRTDARAARAREPEGPEVARTDA